jgi:SPP1 family predicted phage head-tail adaptor
MFKDVVTLITVTNSTNDIGNTIETSTTRQVFANKKSIRQSEFYQAQATGLKPEIAFEIRSLDYNNESKLSYNNKTYIIIRTYQKNEDFMELICEGIVGSEVR